jgi:hypothetical protein
MIDGYYAGWICPWCCGFTTDVNPYLPDTDEYYLFLAGREFYLDTRFDYPSRIED